MSPPALTSTSATRLIAASQSHSTPLRPLSSCSAPQTVCVVVSYVCSACACALCCISVPVPCCAPLRSSSLFRLVRESLFIIPSVVGFASIVISGRLPLLSLFLILLCVPSASHSLSTIHPFHLPGVQPFTYSYQPFGALPLSTTHPAFTQPLYMMSAPPPQLQQPPPGSHPAASPHSHPANNQPAHTLPLQPQPLAPSGPIIIATLPNPILPLASQPQPAQLTTLPQPYFSSPTLPQPSLSPVAPHIPSIISDPTDWKANNEAGMVMHRNGLLENAVEHLTLAVHNAPPDCTQPRRNLAMVKVDIGTRYKLSGNVETAMRLYEEALSVLPSFAPAYFNLAVIYSERAQYEQALKYYQLAVQHNPNYVEALCVSEDVSVKVRRGGVGEWQDVRAGDVCEDDMLMGDRGEATPILPPIVPLHDQPLYRIDCYPHLALSAPDISTAVSPLHSYTVSHRHLVTVQCLATPFLHHHTNLTHLVYYRVKDGHIAAETLVGEVGESGLERLWQRWSQLNRSDVCVAGDLYDVYVEDLWRHLDNAASSHFREHIVGVQVRLLSVTDDDSERTIASPFVALVAPPPTACSHQSSSPQPTSSIQSGDKPSRSCSRHVPLDLVITPLLHTGTVIAITVAAPSRRYLLSSCVATHNCNIGVIYKNSAQLSMAIEYYEKALKANPNFHIAASNLAIALTDKGTSVKNEGRIEEGISYYKRALHHNSKYPSSWYNLGVAYAEKGRADDAKVCYELAVMFDNKCAEAYNNLGVIYKDRGNLDQAIHYYHEALQANPAFSQTLNNLSVIYTMLGKLDEAYEYWYVHRPATAVRQIILVVVRVRLSSHMSVFAVVVCVQFASDQDQSALR